ncbi:MAG: 1,4-alpha-glucan branching protein GlgB [Actinobacteria bacterium]|nr:1,4-alpha-glucan branching protein GlgB [Cyanobacteriota bacterium]MCL5771820.1 1,4-alpha-glucan branching protein GlgB [Actinomycetota bacterium]
MRSLNNNEFKSLFTDYDIYLFKNGTHFKLYNKLGAHLIKNNDEVENIKEVKAEDKAVSEIDSKSEGKAENKIQSKIENKIENEAKHEIQGTYFAVWAPNANSVSVVGNFNGWNENINKLENRKDESGIWETFISSVGKGELYKFRIKPKFKTDFLDKSDPFAFFCEVAPKTASITWDLDYNWNDSDWMRRRYKYNSLNSPLSIYELHPGSWKRKHFNAGNINPDNNNDSNSNKHGENHKENFNNNFNNNGNQKNINNNNYISNINNGDVFLTYREIAVELVAYIKKCGFTHIELLPVMEHPFYGSWGYQITGYFAPTSRYGNPQDFMYFVDYLHQNNIGVILDWVPSHFPDDLHGLYMFDGTHLYEHADKRLGYHPDWKSMIFNYGRYEVKQFLINSALFWLDKYHIDGIRIDAVASMLYLDYSRKEGQWIPNKYGGRENLEAVDFLKQLNEVVYKEYPDVQTIAEESTAWPMVTKPAYSGGLGFGMKWNMGWMHDTLNYFSKDPVYRKHHQDDLKFTFWYAFNENFILPLSHDEVVYGKKSLLEKMPGDKWQKFANLRLLLSYMYAFPGKKLLFMGDEFAQINEWNHERSLDWDLLDNKMHNNVYLMVKDLNNLYKKEKPLYSSDFDYKGFEWIDNNDYQNSILSFLRIFKDIKEDNLQNIQQDIKQYVIPEDKKQHKKQDEKKDLKQVTQQNIQQNAHASYILICCNFTPVPRYNYKIGVPAPGEWEEIFNSDSEFYGGSGHGNFGKVTAQEIASHNQKYSACITLPPLAAIFFKKV